MRFTEEEVSFRFRFQLKAENNPLQSGRLVGFTSVFFGSAIFSEVSASCYTVSQHCSRQKMNVSMFRHVFLGSRKPSSVILLFFLSKDFDSEQVASFKTHGSKKMLG